MPRMLRICLAVSLPLFLNASAWAEEAPAGPGSSSVTPIAVSISTVKVKLGETVETLSTVRSASLSALGPVTEKEIAVLVRQLGHDSFAVREEALKKLLAIGAPAAEQVAAVAASDSLEISMRAFRILDNWMDDEEKMRVVASQSLAKLAENEENQQVANRAKWLLTKDRTAPNYDNSHTMPARPPFIGRIRIPTI